MTVDNKTLVNKAITAADDLATAGKLNDAQSDRFIDYVINETVMKQNIRVVRFRNENMQIDKIGVGARVSMPKEEARDPNMRRGVSTSKVTLTPSAVMTPYEISDEFLELNIEGENATDTIVRMFATATANDLEELGWNGNKLGPAITEYDYKQAGSTSQYIKDGFLALQDGWSLLADSAHVVDAGGKNIGLSVFSDALKAMPTKFRKNKKNLRWFMSNDLYQTYAEKLSTRATNAGDDAAEGKVLSPFGVPIVEVPLWALNSTVVEHVQLNGTTAVSLKYKNISNVVVLPNTLDKTPTTPYVDVTDYTLDTTAGTIARTGGGAIGDGDTVKVTYLSSPSMMLTHWSNFIMGIGREVRIEKDRDIYAGVDQYAISTKVSYQIEETDAAVKVKNIGEGV